MRSGSPIGAPVSRRRFVTIAASVAGLAGLSLRARIARASTFRWTGVALGAEASLVIEHHDEAAAKLAIEACVKEVHRLERIFSLHDPSSAIARLNRDGSLEDAPLDLRRLLADALHLARETDGVFDPTIQPLWSLYQSHFSSARAGQGGPAANEIDEARLRVGWQHVEMDSGRILFARPGMAITLNGIAQGYVTDRVGELLRSLEFPHVLINMGEQLALGPRSDGGAWRVGIRHPSAEGRLIEELEIDGGAVATSGGYGTSFDGRGRFSHLLDPLSGRPGTHWASVTVVAPQAARADGLSTALSLMPRAAWPRPLDPGIRVFAVAAGESQGSWT